MRAVVGLAASPFSSWRSSGRASSIGPMPRRRDKPIAALSGVCAGETGDEGDGAADLRKRRSIVAKRLRQTEEMVREEHCRAELDRWRRGRGEARAGEGVERGPGEDSRRTTPSQKPQLAIASKRHRGRRPRSPRAPCRRQSGSSSHLLLSAIIAPPRHSLVPTWARRPCRSPTSNDQSNEGAVGRGPSEQRRAQRCDKGCDRAAQGSRVAALRPPCRGPGGLDGYLAEVSSVGFPRRRRRTHRRRSRRRGLLPLALVLLVALVGPRRRTSSIARC